MFVRTNDYTYDELGNLKTRISKMGTSTINDDIGTLTYGTNNASVHAVTSAGGKTYQYDKYGNMIKRGNETIDYNVFNKPIRISGNGITTTMDYDADHERFREVNGNKVTYTFAGGMYEEIVEGTKTTQNSNVDGVILNTKILSNNVLASNDTQYLHTDNLGSVEAMSNKLGNFVSRMSFSDWGKRQQSDWKTGSPTDIFPTNNGYTGHDQMDQHSLVHMGGRVYDPGLGRFLSADLFVQSPYSSQSFNRYSYVFNNPLSNVDPSGYMCSSEAWHNYSDTYVGSTRVSHVYTGDTVNNSGCGGIMPSAAEADYKDWSSIVNNVTPYKTELGFRQDGNYAVMIPLEGDVLHGYLTMLSSGLLNEEDEFKDRLNEEAFEERFGKGVTLAVKAIPFLYGAGEIRVLSQLLRGGGKRVETEIAKNTTKALALLPKAEGFASEKLLRQHWKKHGGEWASPMTMEQYLARAKTFLSGAADSRTLQYQRFDGSIVRYSTRTGEFGVIARDGTINTLFRPAMSKRGGDGLEYFMSDRLRNIGY